MTRRMREGALAASLHRHRMRVVELSQAHFSSRQPDKDLKLAAKRLNNVSQRLQADILLPFHSGERRLLDSQGLGDIFLRLASQSPKICKKHLPQKLGGTFPGRRPHLPGRCAGNQFIE